MVPNVADIENLVTIENEYYSFVLMRNGPLYLGRESGDYAYFRNEIVSQE